MKHRISVFLLLAVILSFSAYAGPVHDAVHTLMQPDGSTFRALFRGDEFMRVKTDMYGHSIMQDTEGWWCYASYEPDGRKVSSGCRVGKNVPDMVLNRSQDIPYSRLAELAAEKRQMYDGCEDQPLMRRVMKQGEAITRGGGEKTVKHGIVILAQFANLSFKHSREDFQNLLSKSGYSENGATGCAEEYFDAQFSEFADFEFAVSEIVTLSNDLAYYGANVTGSDAAESDRAPEEMIMEACRLADSHVDFSIYDDDSDGEVDNVFVFFAGGDEAEGAGDDCIWSHAWYIKDGAGRNLVLDGKVINRYACTSEMHRYLDPSGDIRQRLAGIGSFCHEYSHTLGLADLYDTDYDASGGLSDAMWVTTSLMDGGNQNNGGMTPPYFNAVERDQLGIKAPEVIASDGVYSLEPVNVAGRYFRIDTDHEDEYFLLECRSDKGWDMYAGGKGLLIYHIDKSGRNAGYSDTYGRNLNADVRWSLYNEVNCRPDHQCADLMEAMPGAVNARNVFFPLTGVTSVEPELFTSWSGSVGKVSLTNIHMDGDAVVFNVTGFSDNTPPEPVDIVYEKFQDAAVVSFSSSRPYEGRAVISWGLTGKEINTVSLSPYESGKYALVLEGLAARTSYTVSIAFIADGVTGKEGVVSFMTNSDNGGYPYIYLKNVKRNPDGTFPADSRLPLRVYNAVGAENVSWTFNGKLVAPGPDGYYHIEKSGVLKAAVSWEDGSVDMVVKNITVSE